MKTKFLILTMFITFSSFAQTSLKVIATAGDHFEGSSESITWTIGEIAISTYKMENTSLGEGFHQRTKDVVNAIGQIDQNININVFPNPVSEKIFIDSRINSDLQISIRNINGQLVLQTQSRKMETKEINIQHLPAGIYMLLAQTDENKTKSFKIIKK